MTDIYDATPRIFVHGHRPAPPVQTTISIDANPTPNLSVVEGFARFWFPTGETQRYAFRASTVNVVVTTTGTDFTVGQTPATGTSTIGVTQDSVDVAPVNPSLRPFKLSSGSQVDVTADRIGSITPLADQSTGGSGPFRSSETLALWLVGLLVAVAIVSGAVGVTSLWRERRAAPVQAHPSHPAAVSDLSFALPSGPSAPSHNVTEPLPAISRTLEGQVAPQAPWQPTHRVPVGGMMARAIPVADAGDVTNLDANMAVQLVEHRGDWANVVSAEGWSGWVDARELQPESGQAERTGEIPDQS
jgi:hypothetical protein